MIIVAKAKIADSMVRNNIYLDLILKHSKYKKYGFDASNRHKPIMLEKILYNNVH